MPCLYFPRGVAAGTALRETFIDSARFEYRRRLGAGAFGVVYEGYDCERESAVALKVSAPPGVLGSATCWTPALPRRIILTRKTAACGEPRNVLPGRTWRFMRSHAASPAADRRTPIEARLASRRNRGSPHTRSRTARRSAK